VLGRVRQSGGKGEELIDNKRVLTRTSMGPIDSAYKSVRVGILKGNTQGSNEETGSKESKWWVPEPKEIGNELKDGANRENSTGIQIAQHMIIYYCCEKPPSEGRSVAGFPIYKPGPLTASSKIIASSKFGTLFKRKYLHNGDEACSNFVGTKNVRDDGTQRSIRGSRNKEAEATAQNLEDGFAV
jgi:hypothetical protein